MSQQLELFPASDFCQRWTDRVASWRHRSEGGFDATRYDVAPIAEAEARAYVVQHHYSGSYPAARLRYGLFDGPLLVGVAVLSVPVRAEVLTGVFPQLAPYTESLELGRFVLADAVPANAESWFLARVFEQAARDGLRGIVSFSDPMPRATEAGIVLAGHVGTIYQASNALYLGRGRARSLLLLPDGTVLNDRAVAKVKGQQRGHEYVERKLMTYGARAPQAGEAPAAWLETALADAQVRPVAHKGNHRYGFALGTPAERRLVARMIPLTRRAYPKTVDAAA
jgi:hypothetical protein